MIKMGLRHLGEQILEIIFIFQMSGTNSEDILRHDEKHRENILLSGHIHL